MIKTSSSSIDFEISTEEARGVISSVIHNHKEHIPDAIIEHLNSLTKLFALIDKGATDQVTISFIISRD